MVERLVFAGLLMAVGVLLWCGYNRLSIRRLAHAAPADPLLGALPDGVPTILYFTTPYCQPCRTLQRPALDRLQNEFGESVYIQQIDCDEQQEVADRWGVFSAPTTFILDRNHQPRAVNRGVASAETLKRQLQELSA